MGRDFAISSQLFFLITLPMKMELTECSETSARKIQTPENHPKERIQKSILLTNIFLISICFVVFIFAKHYNLPES